MQAWLTSLEAKGGVASASGKASTAYLRRCPGRCFHRGGYQDSGSWPPAYHLVPLVGSARFWFVSCKVPCFGSLSRKDRVPVAMADTRVRTCPVFEI